MTSSSFTTLLTVPYMDPTKYFKPNLLGATVEYDVNLSNRNCGCVAALYLVKAPGVDANGNYWKTRDDYYCDSSGFGGNYCPDFDIMEANVLSF